MRTSSPNMSLIYFLIFSLPFLKSGFYCHVLCMQAHGLTKLLSLLVNLYQMSSRHLCQGSLQNSNFSNTCDCGKHPDKRHLDWSPQWRKGFGISPNSGVHRRGEEGENVQVSSIQCSLSPGLAVMYLQCFSPGNNWESNPVLSYCTSKCTALISSLEQQSSCFPSFKTQLFLLPFLKQVFNKVLH